MLQKGLGWRSAEGQPQRTYFWEINHRATAFQQTPRHRGSWTGASYQMKFWGATESSLDESLPTGQRDEAAIAPRPRNFRT